LQIPQYAKTRDRAGDLQIFSLTLSQLSYRSSKDFFPLPVRATQSPSEVAATGKCSRTRCLEGFYKVGVFIVFSQGFYKVFKQFLKDFTKILQCVCNVVYKAFTKLLQSF
jgi:hypothetical protein